MKKLLLAALMLGTTTGVAHAAPTITSPATLNLINLGTGDGNGLQATSTVGAVLSGYVATPGSGVYSGSRPGTTGGYSSPLSGNANYLAVQPNGSITFSYGVAQTSFAALIGTIDTYNLLTFSGVNGTQQVSGTDILAALGMSNASGAASSTANVQITGLNAFTTVTASDTLASAFEFVPAVASVPEPAAWGMMILGFGLVGGVMRRRSYGNVKVRVA